MSDITLITGLASMFGCLCLFFVCAAQVAVLFTTARQTGAIGQAWDMPQPARAVPVAWTSAAPHRAMAA